MSPIRRVHLVFKTHLDLGFTDFAHNVTATYFQRYIPQAMRVAAALRRAGGPERFVWTTGSWLIYEYLEQAAPAQRAELEAAIAAGDLVWHALPFTTHSELMDADLFRFGLQLSRELDARFGKHTIAAKMTDVPGHTRGIVPLLAGAGVQFLHIGVNAASTPPDVPSLFHWRAPDSSAVTVMYQKGAYGAVQTAPGLDEALAFAHTEDNIGPQNEEQARAAFAILQARFPGAQVIGSTMDAFARRLADINPPLPVVTQEIGDTWIHGVGTDPAKVSRFRELLRLRRHWLEAGHAGPAARSFYAFSRSLLCVPEHTWGLDVKTHLADRDNFRADRFRAARSSPNFRKMEEAWQEQRTYLDDALAALDPPFADEANQALAARAPHRPDLSTWTRVAPHTAYETAQWQFALDPRGALVHLRPRRTGRALASPDHPLGLLIYETFSQADYDRFYRQYIVAQPKDEWWAVPDFTKPGMVVARSRRREWSPRLRALYRARAENADRFLLELVMPPGPVASYGAPAAVWLELISPDDAPELRFILQWFDKRAARLPEALWFSFSPRVPTASGWTMDKLGQPVSPLDVVRDGNRHLHAVGRGVRYDSPDLAFELDTLDAPLVAPGARSLLHFDNRQPPLTHGVHFLLYDNVWGTNFPMWYEDDARFEFVLKLFATNP